MIRATCLAEASTKRQPTRWKAELAKVEVEGEHATESLSNEWTDAQ